jgi:subtilisin-like proprotein convertase family protein
VTNSATLTVNQNVLVSTAPVSITNCPGTSASFSVSATGTGVSYQWFKGAAVLSEQTGSSLILPNVSATDAGTYSVVISGTCGKAVTNSASLTINTTTSADSLLSQTTCPGTTVSFSTSAHGTGPFSYQWLKDGALLSSQTAASLVLSNVTALQAGTYAVQVTGACNSTTNSATLTVNIPTTADALVAQAVCPGTALSISTTAHGTGPFTYKWVKDGKPLSGATTSSWSITNATVLDQGTYVVIVSGTCNAVTNTGTLTVHPPTTATPLTNQTLCFGNTATFSTTAAGTGPFTYLWRKNGLVLDGQTGASLTIPQLKSADVGIYAVEVTGLCNSVTNSATLAVESDGLVSPATFVNPSPIAINDFSAATPYPSSIQVSCVPSTPTQVTVTLTNLSHTYASDISILLVGPNGQAVMLMCDAGDANPINNAILAFSDAATGFLPASAPIVTGVYKPTNYDPDDLMPVPAPLGPYQTNLSTFNASDPNGTWSLYVVDDALIDTGHIDGGWSLTLGWLPGAVAAQLSSPILRSDGCSQVTLQAQQSKTYTIEASTDLLNWTPLATNTLSSSIWDFVDVNSTNFTHRFYRAVYRP